MAGTAAVNLSSADSTDSESETESAAVRPPDAKKSRKYAGAAKYHTKFQTDWKKEFPFITSVPKDPYR